jgi:hypothetical protein
MTRRRLGTIAVAAVIATALAGCFPVFDGGGGSVGGLPNFDQTLRVLAGSEVTVMVPILESAEDVVLNAEGASFGVRMCRGRLH